MLLLLSVGKDILGVPISLHSRIQLLRLLNRRYIALQLIQRLDILLIRIAIINNSST